MARRQDARIAIACVAVFAVMTGAAFAAVPLYRIFCQTTGFAGAVPRAKLAPTTQLAQAVTVSFDTNVRGLPWDFQALQPSQTVRIGQTGLAFFQVTNNSDQPLTGRAAYNVTPEGVGAYFRKLQCFCFSDQTIPAHTTVKFPTLYFIDPQFASDPDTKGFHAVVLSYTFFPAPAATPTQRPAPAANASKPSQALGGGGPARL
ncbi:MAG TPA: cytochrome c oxidase assembly protein [Caulobacteraceae bacterium]|nr:cytochrome c oxidase assembly protein [Caulobacteraceae bacterium]